LITKEDPPELDPPMEEPKVDIEETRDTSVDSKKTRILLQKKTLHINKDRHNKELMEEELIFHSYFIRMQRPLSAFGQIRLKKMRYKNN
jgi:hypothetical protein